MRAGLLLVVLAGLGCGRGGSDGGTHPASVPCDLVIWARPSDPRATVEIATSWDGWTRHPPDAPRADGYRPLRVTPPPGEIAYAIIEDGTWKTDPSVPTTTFHDGHEVTLAYALSCAKPELEITSASGSRSGAVSVRGTFRAAVGGESIDPASVSVATRTSKGSEGDPVPLLKRHIDPASGALDLAFDAPKNGTRKHRFVVHAKDTGGRAAEPRIVTTWDEERPFDWRDLVLYQLIVDRFRGSAGPLAPPPTPSARAGGTLRGVKSAIEDGTIPSLGANAIWLSPLYQNPGGTWRGADGRAYSSYHGYWPTAARKLEASLGSEADLEALIASAHAKGIRVLFDVVPNHTHEEHAYAKAHLHDWFHDTQGQCICGTTCAWETHIEDCWFTPYLPDVDWHDDDAARQISSDVAWWIDRFDGDGVRIDAVPMMPRAANRRIARALRSTFDHGGNRTFVLGENFVGPGNFDLLRYHLGPAGLDSEFDFPLLWALRAALSFAPTGGLDGVGDAVLKGEEAWKGSGAVMSLILGNHDVTRFASEAAGDADGDGWSPAPQPSDSRVYAKAAMAFAILFASPGAPTVYYGDEVGLAGRADPDSRRVMPPDDALSPDQKALRARVARLGQVRACTTALRRGETSVAFSSAEHLVLVRHHAEGDAFLVVTRHDDGPLRVKLDGVPPGNYADSLEPTDAAVGAAALRVSPGLTTLPAKAFSVHLYVPADRPCPR